MANNNKRIVGFFPEFRNGSFGGIQESARIAWSAIETAADSELVCHENSDDNGPRILSKFQALLQARKVSEKSDVVLVWQLGLLKLLPFTSANGATVVVYLHGIEAWKRLDWLTQRALGRVDLFLSNSEFTWQKFLAYNPRLKSSRHRVVPLGIRLPVASDLPIPTSPPAALVISRLRRGEDYKGHRELINAWPQVLSRCPDAQLWIVGDGDLRPTLEALATSLGVEDHVQFFGAVTDQVKDELISRSRCLAMPSRGEGFGLVYLEALRLGRPCLVSTLDAGREVVCPPQGGLAANPDNQSELVEALVRLLSDDTEWRRWSVSARKRYEQQFTAQHFQNRLLAELL